MKIFQQFILIIYFITILSLNDEGFYPIDDVYEYLDIQGFEDEENFIYILKNLSIIFENSYAFNDISKNPPQPDFSDDYHKTVNIANIFILEAAQLLANSIFLFENGYFDACQGSNYDGYNLTEFIFNSNYEIGHVDILTREQIQNLQNRWGKDFVNDSDLNKEGEYCCDCSGLISSLVGGQNTKNSYWFRNNAIESKPIEERKEYMKGWAVYKPGHIGVYDGN